MTFGHRMRGGSVSLRAFFITLAVGGLLIVATVAAFGQTLAPGTYTVPAGTTIVVPTPAIVVGGGTPATPPPVSGSTYTIYLNGVLGGGDGQWVNTFDDVSLTTVYKDTSGSPQVGTYDLKITGGQQWPIWMPYANAAKSFSMASYTSVSFDLKVATTGDPFNFYFVPAGDEACPTGATCAVQLGNGVAHYGVPATMAAGVWYNVTIPLAAMSVAPPTKNGNTFNLVYKFGLQEDSGVVGRVWYVNRVTFQ